MSDTERPLEVLFLTNFSDACFRAIPALAQMVDDLDTQLTILHAYDANVQSRREADAKLHSFFPEADAYHTSRRLLVADDVVSAVKRFNEGGPLDLIVAPGGDPLGFPRIGRSSLRARLVKDALVPVWTIGSNPRVTRLNRRTRNVACWVDLGAPETVHLRTAAEYARALDATLHVFVMIPEMHEGLLVRPLYSDQPLDPDVAADAIRQQTADLPITPQIQVLHASTSRSIARQVARCDADVLFVSRMRAVRHSWLGARVRGMLDRCGCPVIAVDPAVPATLWSHARGRQRDRMRDQRGYGKTAPSRARMRGMASFASVETYQAQPSRSI